MRITFGFGKSLYAVFRFALVIRDEELTGL